METDSDLIKNIQKDACSPCIEKLRERHIGLIIDIYSKYLGVLESVNFSPSDFHDEINYIVYDAARKYDFGRKMKFSSFLGECVRYFCLNKMNELRKNKTIQTEPETLNFLIDSFHKNTHLDKSKYEDSKNYIFDILDQLKDQRIKKIFKYRYFTGNKPKLPWHEIGRILKCSNQTVLNLHNKTIKFLRKKMQSSIEQDII